MATQKFEYFGKYILLEKLATGGMAEVFLGRAPGAGGIGKFVAIKRILPQFADSPEFIDMFKEEAKIAINLNHSNIVSIHEFGVESNQFFLTMDYVEGRNLRQILNKMKKSGAKFSIDQIIYVIKEMSSGLDHAHRCLDANTGKPLNITHRDISPQNTMVSFEGEVKIVDFGIAKAESHLETTRAGTVKGKFGYMSPEQAEGQPVDLRTDIFSMGIVLWELLANDRLFIANNELNTLRKIRDCQIPSLRKINPNIHTELERITQKALARDRNLRYQTSAAIHRDLNRFMNRQYPDFSPQDFAVFIKTLFADEILENRQRLIEYAKVPFRTNAREPGRSVDISGGLNGNDSDTNSFVTQDDKSRTSPSEPDDKTALSDSVDLLSSHKSDPRISASSNQEKLSEGDEKSVSVVHAPKPPPVPTDTAKDTAANAAFSLDEAAIKGSMRPIPPDVNNTNPKLRVPPKPEAVDVEIRPGPSESSINRMPRIHQKRPGIFVRAGNALINLSLMTLVLFGLFIFLAKTQPKTMGPVIVATEPWAGPLYSSLGISDEREDASQAPGPSPQPSEPSPTVPDKVEQMAPPPPIDPLSPIGKGATVVATSPSGAEIYVNGVQTGFISPSRVSLPTKYPVTITLRRAGFADYQYVIQNESELQARVDIKLQAIDVGYLKIDVIPPQSEGLRVIVNGQVFRDPNLPMLQLPIPANKEVKVEAIHGPNRSFAERMVRVQRGQTQDIQLILRNRRPSSTKK